ncbi:hypothetical protein BCV69DRAFT_277002 [Microstroma glucosiphilum]|uniref:5'-3' DNA helicase ZGRF1-like N-terminal domain-containing protein n=1 Tax=Pseudomicrostroma glucosiphilum TaxID=1684307 RepID=A0A316UAW8_9BASI|nr:hypothetical protein BCV69DRAFT_277002 [Pseudomicrostroma glucosiphilum]PWN21621.1 hypothetical protein BCV69DRAFT_277002 [Pseudomicrostroma glucosiphilum]
MASPVASTSALSSASGSNSSSSTPKYAIVRHYLVLFSGDKDKKETNRVWHDGRLAHHTYNGKVFLYDEADIELADQFFTNGSPIRPGGPPTPPVFADDSEVTVRDFVVQIQRFQKVTRTDITPLLQAKELARARKSMQTPQSLMGSPARGATSTAPRTPGGSSSSSASTSSVGRFQPASAATSTSTPTRGPVSNVASPASAARKGPLSPHPFKTPFKSPLKRKEMADRSINSEASPLGPGQNNGSQESRGDADAAKKKRLGSNGAIGGGVARRT